MRAEAATALGIVLTEDADIVPEVLRGLLKQDERLARRLHEFRDGAVLLGRMATRWCCRD